MDTNAIVTILTGVAGVSGGFFGGRRFGSEAAIAIAADTVELLQASIEELRRKGAEKDSEIENLASRVELLESLVTQRAEVEAVHEETRGIRGVVDRIAAKVEA